MQLTASDIYTYYRPSTCELRVHLRAAGVQEAEPGVFEKLLRELGIRHETKHLSIFAKYVDISTEDPKDRLEATQRAVASGASVVYQAHLMATAEIDGQGCQIFGSPDFLIQEENGYIIRDAKISRRINDKDHPEIILQLELYGWLFEQSFGQSPRRLEVFSGSGEIVEIDYSGGTAALRIMEKILRIQQMSSPQYCPVGWSKCNGCLFFDHCWTEAEQYSDVAIIVGVDQGLAIALHQEGINTVDDLLANFDENTLSKYKRPWGEGLRRVGKNAQKILQMARSLNSGQEMLLGMADIPDHSNYVMFDLEGLPPQLDETDRVYLWGMQVCGENPGKYLSALAGFGEEGDKEGWIEFLNQAGVIFCQHGDIRFVHWATYEKTNMRRYLDRYGDVDGIGQRVFNNLLDLLPITRGSIALPVPSYSLKVVEKHIGYERKLDEYGGEWAIAKYIEAVETEDEKLRQEIMNKILEYNHEDLEATWAVLCWLKSKNV